MHYPLAILLELAATCSGSLPVLLLALLLIPILALPMAVVLILMLALTVVLVLLRAGGVILVGTGLVQVLVLLS